MIHANIIETIGNTPLVRINSMASHLRCDMLAKVEAVSKVKLPIQNDYIIATTNWYYNTNKTLRFNLPFNRFYMEESKAKPAEDLVRRNRRNGRNRDTLSNKTYALVYINNGDFVLKRAFIFFISAAKCGVKA